MFKKVSAIFICALFFNFGVASALEYTPGETINYFYGNGCPHCANVKPFLDEFQENHPEMDFEIREVYQNKENAMVMLDFFEQYEVPQSDRGVPAIYVEKGFAVGDKPIINFLDSINGSTTVSPIEYTELEDVEAMGNEETDDVEVNDEKQEEHLTIWAIAAAAFVDSINPCAIAVLLILLSALMLGAEKKRSALMGGLAFTFSIYVSYFLFGLGIVQAITILNIADIIFNIVGIVAIIIGLANLKDFFFYGKGFVMEIPRSWRPTLKKLLGSITSPLGAFLIGFVVMLFELPCTGGPYFFVLGLLAKNAAWTSIIPVLLFYNLVFVLPLLLITFLFYFGYTSIESANKWKEKNIRLLHLIAGIIMLVLGIWVILN